MSKRRRDARRATRRRSQPGANVDGMSNKQMQKAMSQMDTQEISDVIEVIVRTPTEDIVLQNPEVSVMNMGQEIWSVVPQNVIRLKPGSTSSTVAEEEEEDIEIEIKSADVQLIMSSANVEEEKATAALRKAKGDLAAAIMSLS